MINIMGVCQEHWNKQVVNEMSSGSLVSVTDVSVTSRDGGRVRVRVRVRVRE